MRNFVIKTLIILGAMLSVVSTGHANDITSQEDSAKLVHRLSAEMIDTLTNDEESSVQGKKIRAILTENLDIDRIGLLIAGKAIRKTTPEQRAQYRLLIRDYIEIKYSKLLGGYNGQSINIVNTGRAGKTDALVNTQVHQDGSEPISVSWRITNKRDKLLVLDVIIEGISMLRTERSQFEAILKSQKFDSLINSLQEKLAEMGG